MSAARVHLVHVDGRGRVSLGRFAPLAERYLASIDEHGVITLTPTEVVPIRPE